MGLLDEIKSIEKTRITAEYIVTMKKQVLDMFAESWYEKIRTNILTVAKESNRKNIHKL